jgi:hypothetical protein
MTIFITLVEGLEFTNYCLVINKEALCQSESV